MSFERTVTDGRIILSEGSLIDRLHRRSDIALDPHIAHAGLVYQALGRAVLEQLYRGYLDIGNTFGLPMIVCTPTWRACPSRLEAAGFGNGRQVNGDAARFLSAIRETYGEYAKRVFVGGLMGCRGDAYRPEESLSEAQAAAFHLYQADALAQAGVDFLMAATLPAAGEARGMAEAMALCGTPYLMSFVVRSTGTLLDGTPLAQVVSRIDADVEPAPLGYLVNCVHPQVFAEAMRQTIDEWPAASRRIIGLQANTSRRRPEELDNLGRVDESESPEAFAEAMVTTQRRFDLTILGGCCGTDNRHILSIAERLSSSAPE